MSLAPGHKGVDYSGARPSTDSVAWKLCGLHEISDAVKGGLDFFANCEWYESRITEGAAAGHDDGAADLAFWKSRGLAKGASIFVSWDQSPAESKWAAAIDYLKAYGAALGGYYHVDCYAGTPFLRHALALKVIRYGWRPNAGAWSGDGLPYKPTNAADHLAAAQQATVAAIWQTGNYWFGKDADENVVLRVPTGSHMQALEPHTPPTTSGEFTMDKEAAARFDKLDAEVLAVAAALRAALTDNTVGGDGKPHTMPSLFQHFLNRRAYMKAKKKAAKR